MIKRRQGNHVRGRSYHSQCRDLRLMALTHNVMILMRREVFYRAGPGTNSIWFLTPVTLRLAASDGQRSTGKPSAIQKPCQPGIYSTKPGGETPCVTQSMTIPAECRILLVEDDAELASMVADFLTPHGFAVLIEGRGDRAVERIHLELHDAVILDVNLPGLDGFSVCRTVRSRFTGPILILTARGEELDEVVGLEVGADDYIAKPVRPRVLLARLRAHLRKVTAADNDAYNRRIMIGTLRIDAGRRTVELMGQEIELTTAEFDLLWLLAENVGQVVSRSDIYQRLHGLKHDGADRSIDLRVSRLRKKLGDDPINPQRIKSVRGVGYLLSVEQ